MHIGGKPVQTKRIEVDNHLQQVTNLMINNKKKLFLLKNEHTHVGDAAK